MKICYFIISNICLWPRIKPRASPRHGRTIPRLGKGFGPGQAFGQGLGLNQELVLGMGYIKLVLYKIE